MKMKTGAKALLCIALLMCLAWGGASCYSSELNGFEITCDTIPASGDEVNSNICKDDNNLTYLECVRLRCNTTGGITVAESDYWYNDWGVDMGCIVKTDPSDQPGYYSGKCSQGECGANVDYPSCTFFQKDGVNCCNWTGVKCYGPGENACNEEGKYALSCNYFDDNEYLCNLIWAGAIWNPRHCSYAPPNYVDDPGAVCQFSIEDDLECGETPATYAYVPLGIGTPWYAHTYVINETSMNTGVGERCCRMGRGCYEDTSGVPRCLACIPDNSATTCDPALGGGTCCSGNCEFDASRGYDICKPIDCVDEGNTCSLSAECCDSRSCISGVCGGCIGEGIACSADSECCQETGNPLFCDASNSPTVCKACYAEGESCAGGQSCCGGLSCDTSGAAPVCAGSAPVVGFEQFADTLMLCALAGIAMAALIALAYMAGEFLQNPRLLEWAKTEALQLFVSLAVVAFLLFALYAVFTAQIGEVFSIIGAQPPTIFQGYTAQSFYGGAIIYLEKLGAMGLANIAEVRYNLGVYEIRTTYTEYECPGSCILSLASYNKAVYGGETMDLAIANNLLGTATVSYLSVVFQYFTLQYIVNGIFVMLLPAAIVIRSIPFMRHFGGALIGIFVALYVLYPLLIVLNAVLAPSLAVGMQGAGPQLELAQRTTDMNCDETGYVLFDSPPGQHHINCNGGARKETKLEHPGITASAMEGLGPSSITDLMRLNVLIFLTAVFLPALDFIIIAALARDISRLLGEEVDIGRLGQMV